MLRRHLLQGGAPVAPCSGFDADLANAYLERALSPLALNRFETHLAGCAECRHHVVALARLADTLTVAPVRVAPPVLVAEPAWMRWRTAVAQWFDLPQWNLGWTAGAMACGALLAVLGVRAWQQTRVFDAQPGSIAASNLSAENPASASTAASELATGSAGNGLPEGTEPNTGEASANGQEAKSVAPDFLAGMPASQFGRSNFQQVPPPAVLPSASLVAGPVAFANKPEVKVLPVATKELDFGTRPVPPPALNVVSTVGQFNMNASGLALPVGLQAGTPPLRSAAPFTALPPEPAKQELVAELVLPEPRRARRSEKAPEASSSLRNRDLLKALKGRAAGFMPFNPPENPDKDDARTKEANVKEAQEQSLPLMKRMNGHVFYFEHGFWIDEEYKSEAKLPLKRLVRGSQEYQQTQIENPSLEQFFQLGQVIVVWKGVVYEVRK